MRNIGIRYYKMGFYTNEQFALFVKVCNTRGI